jgi:hypothetical protein
MESEAALLRSAVGGDSYFAAFGQLPNAGCVISPHIQHPGGRVARNSSPVAASERAWDLNVIPQMARRSEDTGIMSFGEHVAKLLLFRRFEIWVYFFRRKGLA